MRRLSALVAALALMLSLTACTGLGGVTGFDATLYVRGLLDETYRGTYDEAFLQLVSSTKAEAENAYRTSIDVAYQYFCKRFEVDDTQISDDARDLLCDLLRQIYQGARYEVHAAVLMENNEYAVRVTVYPVTVLAEILEDDYPASVASFNKLYADMTEEKLADMGRTEQEAFWHTYEEAWAGQVAKLLESRMGTITRGDPEVMLVRVYSKDGGAYTVSSRELALLDELLIDY